MDDTLTRPERFTEYRLARQRLPAFIKDPCSCCLNRGPRLFGRTHCKVDGRTYFDCRSGKTLPTLEPDEEKFAALEAIKDRT